MKLLTKLEELAFVLLSVYLFSRLPYAWWWYPVLFFSPDLSFIGYAGGKRLGAAAYNLVHHKAVAVIAFLAGELLGLPVLTLAGVILLGHSSLDRALGFGLQEADAPAPSPAAAGG